MPARKSLHLAGVFFRTGRKRKAQVYHNLMAQAVFG